MISIVIPFYNEELMISSMIQEVMNAMQGMKEEFEIVAVDDGSTDFSLKELIKIKEQHSQLKIISLSRNFGHQAAITAGLEYSAGQYIVLIDGDLQDPPELIPQMHQKLVNQDFDLIIGRRTSRKEKFSKRIAIKIFHKIYNEISGLDDIYNTGNFCMMKRSVVNAILQVNEKTRYIPGLRSFVGFKRCYLDYDRPERAEGESKMSFRMLLSLAADAIFSFSKWPIKACLWIGILGILFLMVAIVYSLVSKALDWAPLGWSSTILSIYFIGTIQLIFMGVMGEYLYRIYKEVQKRPIYIIRKVIE